MTKLTALHEAMTRLDEVWEGADEAAALSRAQLVAVNRALGVLQLRVDAVQADVAGRIAHESRPELGAESLAKQHGFRSPVRLIAAVTGKSAGDAARLVAVGEATASRSDLLGAHVPARYPHVRAALAAGTVGAQAAAAIIDLLDRCRVKAGSERIAEAEQALIEKASELAFDDVRKMLVRAETWLNPAGVQASADARRARRSVTMFERDGMLHLHALLDIESAAPVVTAIRGFVTASFAARTTAPDPDAPDADRRTVPMLQADALTTFCDHMLGCEAQVPLAGATVIVRVSLQDVTAGTGSALIDGLDQPVGIGTVRRIAAGGGIIPWVLGADSEILDWGREKRLFTRAQRLALVERDGGCAMCGLPPGMTKAHHIRWWQRDAGPTDLCNAVLLCETCHHRIHDNGWEIRIGDSGTGAGKAAGSRARHGAGIGARLRTTARVWFIPPPYVDPARTPRLGGRARVDIAA